MSKTSSEDWQELLNNWQTQQLNSTQKLFDVFGQWQKSVMPSADSNTENEEFDTSALYSNMQAMNAANQALFDSMAKEYQKNFDDNTHQFLFKSLSEMVQPQNWLNLSGDLFNMGAHNISDKPFVSGFSDVEERFAYATDSWKQFLKENQQYHSVVMKSWVKAYEKFTELVKEQQQNDSDKLFSPRELIDLWTTIADEELMGLHRSESFLAAQKDMIKASMEYRLHEKNIAEVLCESLHIPTRVEVDELHQSVTLLKRELRKTKQRLQALEAEKTIPKKPSTKKPKASAKARTKSIKT